MIQYKYNPSLPFVRSDYKGNPSFKNRFMLREDSSPSTIEVGTLAKWFLSKNPQREEKKASHYHLDIEVPSALPDDDFICWLGHSSFLLKINGVTIITDPVLYDIPFYKRHSPTPIEAEELPPIDYLLISHNHYDHLDLNTIRRVNKSDKFQILAPLEVGKHLGDYLYQEAGWYQEYRVEEEGLRIIYLPAKHWSRRKILDTNRELWGSFLVTSPSFSLYFAGDTAYDPRLFSEISETIASVSDQLDLALLPIGAYKPGYIMKASHTTPEETWKICNDLRCRYMLPMHYGTYDLADEPLGEPIERYREIRDERGLEVKPGEITLIQSLRS